MRWEKVGRRSWSLAVRLAASCSPILAPTWGRITSTVTTSRQIQLGVKLAF